MSANTCTCGHSILQHDKWGCQHVERKEGKFDSVCQCDIDPDQIVTAMTERIAKLEALLNIAGDVNTWLKNNNLKDTAHQRALEAALKALK